MWCHLFLPRFKKKSDLRFFFNKSSINKSKYTKGIMDWLKNINGLLIDITGVLYECRSIDQVITGSIEAINLLRDLSIKFILCSNESRLSAEKLKQKLNNLGFNFSSNEVLSISSIVLEYLKENSLTPFLIVSPDLYNTFNLLNDAEPNCVVIGDASESFNYKNMNEAFRILMADKMRKLISMGKSKFFKEDDNLTLDVGPFTAALEFACDRNAVVIGKPDEKFFHLCAEKLGLNANEIVMVGDDIASDINGAQKAGFKGVLVRTGKYRKAFDEPHSFISPDLVCDNLFEFVNLLKNSRS